MIMRIKFTPSIREKQIRLTSDKDSAAMLLPSGKKQISIGIGDFNLAIKISYPQALRDSDIIQKFSAATGIRTRVTWMRTMRPGPD